MCKYVLFLPYDSAVDNYYWLTSKYSFIKTDFIFSILLNDSSYLISKVSLSDLAIYSQVSSQCLDEIIDLSSSLAKSYKRNSFKMYIAEAEDSSIYNEVLGVMKDICIKIF